MPSEVVKTRKIISSVKTELTEDEITAYVIDGMKRDHKDLKDYEMTVQFQVHTSEKFPPISATVSGEKVG